MARRTLAEARCTLDQMLPVLSDFQANESRQVLAEAERLAKQRADAHAAALETEIRQARDAALRELTAVRDAFEDLASEGALGRMPAALYQESLRQLRDRQAAAEAELAKAGESAALVEQIESDPIAWFDDLVSRHPGLRPEVPW